MMATTRWVTDDGRSYVGDEVRITWDTPGEPTVTQHLRAGGTVTHTVTTTEAPVEAWPVAEGILPAGLVPHEGTRVPTEVGGFEADGVTPATVLEPDPWVT